MSEISTRIAVAMLEYMQPTEWPSSPAVWWLWPDPRRLRHDDLCATLEAMPKPVALGALVEHGCVGVWRIAEAVADVRGQLEYRCLNQLNFVRQLLAQLAPSQSPVSIRLDVEGDDFLFSSADLEVWAQEYFLITSGWTLAECRGDARASVRLVLQRPGMLRASPGLPCGGHRPRAA
jgi:hypothetical protein